MKKILCVFGTRPEAIKFAPIIKKLEQHPGLKLGVCVTGQHREMLDQVLQLFEIKPDFDLDVMTYNQSLSDLTSQLISDIGGVIKIFSPDCVLVHGDTTTTLCASLASFYQKIDVGHIEAGLRTNDIYSPWPEEINRQVTSRIGRFHFVPTPNAKENLLRENIPESNIFFTGNTIVDSLLYIKQKIDKDSTKKKFFKKKFSFLDPSKKLILVTGHRRENFGKAFEEKCNALRDLALSENIEIIFPVHLNPYVQKCVNDVLTGTTNIHLIDPVDYESLVYLMSICYMVISDSGGIQEEAPSFGKPVLVTRDTTERPEGIDAGIAFLVGTNKKNIIKKTRELLNNEVLYKTISKIRNPYGDGYASEKIIRVLEEKLMTAHAREAA